jgi:uridine kinase
MDSFYNILNEKQIEMANKNTWNFDHPDAFDLDLVVETLVNLKLSKRVQVPVIYKLMSRFMILIHIRG